MNRSEIEAWLPHRAPFLFLDSALEHTNDGLTARWRVPADADWFRGHYPLEPILPGVLICEHAFQAGALFIALTLGGFRAEDGIPVLTRLENARFRRLVRPGEELTTQVALVLRVGPAWKLRAKVSCAEARVCELECVLAATGAMARLESPA